MDRKHLSPVDVFTKVNNHKVLEHVNGKTELTFEDVDLPTHLGAHFINSYANEQVPIMKWLAMADVSLSLGLSKTNVRFNNVQIEMLDLNSAPNCTLIINDSIIETIKLSENTNIKNIHISNSEIKRLILTAPTHKRRYIFENCLISESATHGDFEKAVKFIKCTFGNTDGDPNSVNFSNSNFKNSVSFEYSVFKRPPLLFGAHLHPDSDFTNCTFNDLHSPSSWRAYRTLKHFMIDHESDHEAALFHALELEARKNTVLPKGFFKVISSPDGIERIASVLLDWVSSYGRDLRLPLGWLIVISVYAYIFYTLNTGYVFSDAHLCHTGSTSAGWLKDACNSNINLLYSIRNGLGPFGLLLSSDQIIPANLFVKYFGFGHFVLSSIIWFIWLLQIRSRFKM